MGKQWGGETGSKRRDAQERATRQHGTGGMKAEGAVDRGGKKVETRWRGKSVGCDGLSLRTGLEARVS